VLTNVFPVLYAATMGMGGLCQRGVGHHKPLALWHRWDGSVGVPDEIAVLCLPAGSDDLRVRAANLGGGAAVVRVAAVDGLMRRRERPPYAVRRYGMRQDLSIMAPWEELGCAAVRLEAGEVREIVVRS